MPQITQLTDNHSLEIAVHSYGNLLFRICLSMLGSRVDAEDAVQETFLRYMSQAPPFRDSGHEKAWLIRVSINHCKNLRGYRLRHAQVSLPEWRELGIGEQQLGVLEALQQLPPNYQVALQLFYLEGYSGAELAALLGISHAAARKRLQKGRELLKMEYERED